VGRNTATRVSAASEQRMRISYTKSYGGRGGGATLRRWNRATMCNEWDLVSRQRIRSDSFESSSSDGVVVGFDRHPVIDLSSKELKTSRAPVNALAERDAELLALSCRFRYRHRLSGDSCNSAWVQQNATLLPPLYTSRYDSIFLRNTHFVGLTGDERPHRHKSMIGPFTPYIADS
jgi:hypothetical protein